MRSSKWKQASALLLAVCMTATLAFSDLVPGAFAQEDVVPAATAAAQPEAAASAAPTAAPEPTATAEPAVTAAPTAFAEPTPSAAPAASAVPSASAEPSAVPEVLNAGNEAAVNTEPDAPETYAANENTIVFDLAKGSVVFRADKTYLGYDADGQLITGAHIDSNSYEIKQSVTGFVKNTITVETANMYSSGIDPNNQGSTYNITFNNIKIDSSAQAQVPEDGECEGVEITSHYYRILKQQLAYYQAGRIFSPFMAGDDTVSVNLTLVGDNALYAQKGAGATLQYAHYPMGEAGDGSLAIKGDGKLSVKQTTQDSINRGACIGGPMLYQSGSSIRAGNGKIVFEDGTVLVETAPNSYSSAIGGGSCSPAEQPILFNGSTVTAKAHHTSATIGAGGGSTGIGENANQIEINAGIVVVYNPENGVGIGAGTSESRGGGSANIKITGGDVTVYGPDKTNDQGEITYGKIGGGTSGDQYAQLGGDRSGGSADITISGGTIKAKSIGGGSTIAPNANGGKATIVVNGEANITTESIGGGESLSGNGGNASVRIEAGTFNVSNTIGGGDSQTGNGGDASIYVSGGTLNCASIGGGNSVSGKPGAVTSATQVAGVVVTGGTLNTGTIGGGTNANGDIGFATADISGGQIQGRFILANTDPAQKCFFRMTGGTIDNTALLRTGDEAAQKLGGAVYLSDPSGEVTISGGKILNSSAVQGGAVYMTAGKFTLSGKAELNNCTASVAGGAVYLANGTVEMDGGAIVGCTAKQGGAVYLKDGTVTLANGAVGIESAPNKAEQGAGVYLAGGSLTVSGSAVQYNTAATGAGAYLASGTMTMTGGRLLQNKANESGGGAYLAGGALNVSGGLIQQNSAAQNGGGAYLADGSLALSGGRIAGNTAVNGAGAYLQKGSLTVSGGGDFDSNTASQNGGGAYLAGGALTVDSGTFSSNTATENGGGAYLAGGTLTINGGSFGSNTARNGGGAYAADGAVRMFGGFVTGNRAEENGGGLYVSSAKSAADVVVRSGSITNNTSGGHGGGIAVAGSATNTADKVVLGLLETHPNLNADRSFTAFDYTDTVDSSKHNHASCPVLTGNTATGNGGGIYMSSPEATLSVYCLTESGNTSQTNANGNSVMTEGGTVVIGDEDNHARGNIEIGSSMLVEGGTVDIWGSMHNPKFDDNILVNIQENAGHFEDHRGQDTSEKSFKVHYFENFTDGGVHEPTGLYTAKQYENDEDVPALGTLFTHEGWKIVEWNKAPNGMGTRYNIGDMIGGKDNHQAWPGNVDEPLILYAIWQRVGYTVVFHPNAPAGTAYTGSMADQKFEYNVQQELTPNGFKITGKRFNGWNTSADGSGTAYEADYKASLMTNVDGATVNLYAQWVDCTHLGGEHPGNVTYTAAGATITETCDCGYTASVTLSAVSSYYDQQEHPARLSYNGTPLEGAPTITYQYRESETGAYGALKDGETEPTSVGHYKASITLGDKTVFVEYVITSPAEGVTLAAKTIAGQYFTDFNGGNAVTISQDDAFTVQFDVLNLNTQFYQTEPKLDFGAALPEGTTIIMQTGNTYWYVKVKSPAGSDIALTAFTKMGGTETFRYDATTQTQMYRFIVDFSQASETAQTRTVSLTYTPTGAAGDLTGSINLTTQAKQNFGLTDSGERLTVQAPKADANNRWHGKTLMLVLAAPADIPADATLTVTVDDKTTVAPLNERKQFVVPLDWAESQTVTFRLNSDLAAQFGKQYDLKASLYTGAAGGTLAATGKTANLDLTIPASTAPSLKLSGDTRVVSINAASLPLTVAMKNMDGCKVSATIQVKQGNGYGGNFLTGDLQAGQQSLSLSAITAPGSYRVYATVSKDGRTLLNVPYYFIVK